MKLILKTPCGVYAWNNDWTTLRDAKRFAPTWLAIPGCYALADNAGNLIECDPDFPRDCPLPIGNPYRQVPAEILLYHLNGSLL